MIGFLFLPILIYIIAHLIDTYVVCKFRRLKNKIGKDHVVLITGGCMGIGRRTALLFSKINRCNIIILDIRSDLAEKISSEIKSEGGNPYFYHCNLGDQISIESTLKKVIEDHKHVDILINNAGIVSLELFKDSTLSSYQRVTNVNYLGPVQMIQTFLPIMERRGAGQIVNIASVVSVMPGIKVAEYVASKHALWGFHHCLRQELKMLKSPVKTTIICPYAIDTKMFKGFKTNIERLIPMLDEAYVGEVIYDSVVCQREVVFIREFYDKLFHLLRLLPWSFLDRAQIYLQGKHHEQLEGRKKDQ